ncbi:MAG: hypothetical protein HY340_01015, partial [Candidatus Kerfeldbacteria bacterium]|nr:hypothetical protein [Candidatus Kerfeldbacteria bacterium]
MARKQSTAFQRTTTMFFSPRFVALLFLIGAVLPSTAQAAWTEPTASPPGGNVAAPLNVSDNDQTKVGGSLTVQVGGVAGRTPDDTWSIQGVAPNAAGGAAMGVLGTGSDAAGGTSAGVYGISYQGNGTGLRVGLMGVAGFNSSNSYGVYGYDGSQFGMNNAYAGYFRGRTGVEGEICLNGDCIADWTQIGGGLFTHDQLRNITYRTDTNANIALGGTDDSNAAFFFNVSPAANRGIFVAEKSITIGPDVGSAGNNGICTSPPETCSDQDCWGRQDGCDFDEICNPNGDGSCIQTDNTPPTAPGNLRLNGQAGSDNVPLMWDASNDGGGSGVAGYRIFRCQGVGCTPTVQLQQIGNQTTYTDTTVSPSTTYNYHVTAFDNQNNESGPSNVLEVVTPAGGGDTTAPSIPENLRTNGTVLSNLVPLAWDPSFDEPGGSGMAGYKLYRCSVSPTCNPTLYQTLGLVTNFDDTGVSRNTLYIYYVTAFDGANNESDPSNWWPVYTPQGGSSPVILKDEDPVPPPPPGALLEEANRNIARRLRERSQPVEEPVIGGVRPLSRLLGVPTAQAKFNLFSIPTANAGPPFDALDNVRLTVNNGVIQIVTGPPVQVMEIGYGSSDIASTTDIILRPGTRSQAQGARFFQSGNDTALRLTSHVTVGDSGTTDAGSVRYNSGDLQGYVAGQWVSLTNHGTGGVVLSADQVIWNATATNPLGTFPQDASIDVASAISGRTLYGDPIYTQGVVTDATFAVPGTGPSAHRVGIGTITPNALLEVQNDDEFVPATIRLTNTFSTPGIWELQSRQNPSPALNNAFVIWGGSQGAEDFRLTIDRDGDVGIGTGQTDPLARLHVVGTAKIGSATTSNDLIIGRSAVATGTTPQSDICFTKADGVLECINEWSDLTGFGVGGIQGSGTANFVPRFVTPTTIGDSVIFQDVGANIGINRSAGLAARLDVQGSIRARGQLYVDPNDNGTPDLFVDSAAGQTRVSVGSAVATAALLTVDNGSIWARGAEGDIVIGGTLTAIGQTAGTPELCFQGSCIDAFNDLILNTAAFGVIAQPGGFYVAGNGRVGGTLTVDQGPLQLPTSNRTTYDTRFERNSGSLDGYNISTKLVFGAASNQWGLGIFSDENLNVPIVTITEDRKVHLGSAANPTDLCLYGPGGPGCRSDWPEQSGGVVTAADQVIWNATATNPLGGFPQPASIKVGSAIMGESFYGGPTYDINGAVAAATFAVT